MKDFLKTMLAVVAGFIVITLLCFAVLGGIIGSVSSAGKTGAPLPKDGGVLVIDLSKTVITEQTVEANPVAGMYGQNDKGSLGLWECVQAINSAASDPIVKYIYLKPEGSGTSIATMAEIRKALQNFRSSGKAVVAYLESPSTGSYYLASVADKVYMTSHPGASSMMVGVNAQMMFLKDLLDKLGVNIQLIRHGKYKSAGETFIRSEASPENREQYQAMVNSMWKSLSSEICESRGISESELNAAIDELKLCLPKDYLDCRLADELLTRDQLEDKLASLAVVDNYSDVKRINFSDYVLARNVASKAHNKIAIIYANGEIVDGSDKKNVAGDRFASVIEKVRRDSSVKAVVLRVNSPGGSVIASEKIKRELDLLKADKPIVASYGDYAASGGYWISNNADKIFSDAVTLTGSIGVFGMVPDFSKTLKNVAHVNMTTISSNKHGDMYSLTRPFDSAEYAYMQRSIEDIYDRFTTIVSEGRGIEKTQVDAIGQGRVWTGADALNIRLVDEIGTLEDAVRYAAIAAGDADLSAWNIQGYPKPLTVIETVMESMNTMNQDSDEAVWAARLKKIKEPRTVARMPYNITIK